MEASYRLKFKPEPQDGFYYNLKKQVSEYLTKDKTSNSGFYYTLVKTILLLSGFSGTYATIYLAKNNPTMIISYLFLGVFVALIFLNIIHDGVHNCLFSNQKLNRATSYLLDLFGANGYIWKIRHVQLHHPYPNVPEFDTDVKQSIIVRLNENDKWYFFHRYQHIYMAFLYFFYTLYWMTVRDFKDFFGNSIRDKRGEIPTKEYVKLFVFKSLYLTNFILLPSIFTQFTLPTIILGFLVMHFSQSCIALTALLSAHVPEDAIFVEADHQGQLPYSWAELQIVTTLDFATKNPIINTLYGGFNHHVAHHLFPNINHTHYPKITQIIIKTAQKHNIKYKSMGILEAISSHFRLLKKQGRNHRSSKTFQ
jgi:linoleoyl-CoA desaturase